MYDLTGIKEDTDNTLVVVDFNIPLTTMDRSFRKEINKETIVLNDILG